MTSNPGASALDRPYGFKANLGANQGHDNPANSPVYYDWSAPPPAYAATVPIATPAYPIYPTAPTAPTAASAEAGTVPAQGRRQISPRGRKTVKVVRRVMMIRTIITIICLIVGAATGAGIFYGTH